MQADLDLHPLFTDPTVRGLVFDLDGTLIDSATDILDAMRLTFEEAGYGRLPEDYFPDNLHGTSEGIMRFIMNEMGWEAPTDLSAMKARYVTNYRRLDHRHTRLYPGAAEALSLLRATNLPMGICTNKVHLSAVAATRKLGIHGDFNFITGSDTWGQAKPSPLPLLETVRMLGIEPDTCLYFGDTSVDAECARAAGVRFVLHESGYGDAALSAAPRHFGFRHWSEFTGSAVEIV